MAAHSLELLDRYGSGGKAIVLARLKSHQELTSLQFKPSLFVPVAA
jgi:hypothetical protein